MTTILNIVERAYQGTLEEQDDQALWLIHALKNAGAAQSVLLRGPATGYAVREQLADSLEIGGVKPGNPVRIDQDLQRLIEAGVKVWAIREDAKERGIAPEDTLAGIQWVDRAEVAGLFQEAARIFAW